MRRFAGCAQNCPSETTLIGFCGAPWTVATYMIAGHGTPDQAPARLFAYREPAALRTSAQDAGRPFGRLSDPPDRCRRGCRADFRFLVGRARRGVVSRRSASRRWPRSCGRFARSIPMCRSSAFPRAPARAIDSYRAEDRRDRAGARLDGAAGAGAATCSAEGAVQGNLDPLRLVAGGKALSDGVDAILDSAGRWTADLQSRPRHHAGDADRACRGDGETGAERDTLMATSEDTSSSGPRR